MSFEQDINDSEEAVTERFRVSISKFIFSTLDPADHTPNLSTLRPRADIAATSSTKGKRKTPEQIPSKNIVKKLKRGYAPPETYAHLSPLTDYLTYGLDVVFCGINPGYMSAQTGHHFANPTNHFWKCLHQSGFTSKLLPPSDDYSLPAAFNIGLTNLVNRPSAEASELSSSERVSSVPALLTKLALHRPKFLCLVGTSNWDVVRKILVKMSTGSRNTSGSSAPAKNVGLQPFKLCYPPTAVPLCDTSSDPSETLLFVVPSTSGRVVQYQLPDKIKLFSQLKSLVERLPSESDMSTMTRITVLPSNP